MNKNKEYIIVSSIISFILLVCIILLLFNKKTLTYNVTFETNGGTPIETQIVKKGEIVKKPANPEKDGYIFDNWTYLGKIYDFNLKVVSDLNLVAKWTKVDDDVETYNIVFNTDGGSAVSMQIIKKGEMANKPINPIKDGYTFIGWTLDDEIYDFEKIVEKNLELKAKWEKIKESNGNIVNNIGGSNSNNTATSNNQKPSLPQKKTFVITFNTKGGSSISSQKVTEGNKVRKPSNPTRNGYSFIGWFLNGKTYDFNLPVTSNITLEANWTEIKKNNYTVTFNSNGGSYISPQIIVDGNKVSKPTDPIKNGFNFIGWLLNGKIYDFNSAVNENMTLVASWKQKNYKVVANSVDQTATFSKILTIYEDGKVISVKEIQYSDGQFICSGDNLNVNYYAIEGETTLRIVLNDGTVVNAILDIN